MSSIQENSVSIRENLKYKTQRILYYIIDNSVWPIHDVTFKVNVNRL